jgi:hypothetical protein
MMVDEEGLLKANCVINNRASSIADRLIVGKAIVIHKDDLEVWSINNEHFLSTSQS